MSTIPCLPDVFEAPSLTTSPKAGDQCFIPRGFSGEFQNQTILINLDRLRKIDSLALALFVETRQRLASVGGRLILFGTRKDVRRIFEMTKLDRLFTIFSSREEALAGGHGISAREAACIL